jgi:hypothetical protein
MGAALRTYANRETLRAERGVPSIDELPPAVPRPIQCKRLFDPLSTLWEGEPLKAGRSTQSIRR